MELFEHINEMKLAQENNVEALLSQLYVYRKHLIEQTHNYQENIDCLDYLIYSLKKPNENKENVNDRL